MAAGKKKRMGQGGGERKGEVKRKGGKVALQMANRLGGICLRQEIGKNCRWQKCNPGPHAANTEYVSTSLAPEY